ncbi:MAG TPA: O-antigen ligase family protein, partial [Polyangiaceae bacterium]
MRDGPDRYPPEGAGERSRARAVPAPERLLVLSLALLVIGSVMAAGSVHVWSLIAVATLAHASAVVALWRRRTPLGSLSPIAWLILGLAAYSAFQAVPFPMRWVARVAPESADIWARALRPLEQGAPQFIPLSLDPGASLLEALKWTTYAAILVIAAMIGKRGGLRGALAVVFGSAVAVALVTIVHGLAGAEKLFGIYAPRFATPRWGIPPLLNSNNLAGYLNLGVFSGIALLFSDRRRATIWFTAVGLSLVVAVMVLSASRGGVIALSLGLLCLPLVVWAVRRKSGSLNGRSRNRTRTVALFLVPAVVGGLVLALLGSSEGTWEELFYTGVEKLQLLGRTTALIGQLPWFGVGRGAFETAFTPFRPDSGPGIYSYPENFVAQWLAEWGLPIGALALGAFMWLLRPGRLQIWREMGSVVAFLGVLVLLLHNLTDIALEVPAVCIALGTVIGALEGNARRLGRTEPGRGPARSQRQSARRRRGGSALLFVLAGSSALASVLLWDRHPAWAQRDELSARFSRTDFTRRAAFRGFARELGAAMIAHPADPFFPLLGGLAATQTPDVNPVPWIARSLERDFLNGRSHLLLARVLAKKGLLHQALLEAKLAAKYDPTLIGLVATSVTNWTDQTDRLRAAVPEGRAGASMLVALARALPSPERREQRRTLVDEAIGRDPSLAEARAFSIEEVLADLESKAPPCQGDLHSRCIATAMAHLRELEHLEHNASRPLVLRARVMDADRGPRAAYDLL